MKNILAAVDFSPASEKILAQAEQLARMSGAKIWIVHIAAPEPSFVGYDVGPQYIRDHRAETLRTEHQLLQEQAALLQEKGLKAEALLVSGPTSGAILDEADRVAADLLVIGSHGHSMVFELLVGSVSADVLRRATVPILVVPIREA
ncbi:MAG: universal stress protein [Bacteroidia bacterium]|nr:universal stress protein [Bacteroidia bacterium]